MLRVVSHIVLSSTNFFQQLCILLFLHLLIVLQISNLLVLVLHMSKNCIHTCISDYNRGSQFSKTNIRCKQSNFVLGFHFFFEVVYQNSFSIIKLQNRKQLFKATRSFFFHYLLTNTCTYSKYYTGKNVCVIEQDYPTILTHTLWVWEPF